MFGSVLVVCTGNICRSPMAERIMKQYLPEKNIRSVGLMAMVDHPADETASIVSGHHGVSLEGHKGRQFRSSMAGEYDLILVMETGHLEKISSIAPQARGKIMLLGHWSGRREIPDPYRKSQEAFESVYQLIDQACQRWAQKLTG
ncbi:low molecular weight phosphotyrosine protein phosphatase [Rahnella sp. PD12R]|uniref:arsenate reductase/protein-tyrosine-phosphatase family protein n=1 Tax=Rahnella sp. PD12R TaxID=2855688 RepID=UPI001C461944|nr:low molecular weight phosphotyrosine protein phosphatase [Rahnella sp. PD12R]MBV6821027.1 low molecular weight phosphotyrosine protein phosphatase [Rahnella sp. PD12R]